MRSLIRIFAGRTFPEVRFLTLRLICLKIDEHRLTYEEAVKLYMKCKNHVDKEEMVIDAFRKFDEDQKGFILTTELR